MTTDPTPLQERIARAIASADGVGGPDGEFLYSHYAAAVLPLIAAEVRKAQAEAWDEGWEAAIDQAPGDVWFDEWHYQTIPYPEQEN